MGDADDHDCDYDDKDVNDEGVENHGFSQEATSPPDQTLLAPTLLIGGQLEILTWKSLFRNHTLCSSLGLGLA